MELKNTKTHYGLIAILLHWVMAVLIIGLLILGLYMTRLPVSLEKLKFYGWHKEFGILVLFLVIVRWYWRLINLVPTLTLPWYEKLAARAVHLVFYLFMMALPITGWLMSSAAGLPPSFFGFFTLPSLVAPNPELMKLLAAIHEYLAYALIGIIGLHTLAALKHHFVDRDDILKRMIK